VAALASLLAVCSVEVTTSDPGSGSGGSSSGASTSSSSIGSASTSSTSSTGPLFAEDIVFKRADSAGNPGETVTSFKTGDRKIFAQVTLNRVVENFQGKAVWKVIKNDSGDTDTKIGKVQPEGVRENVLTVSTSLRRDWPAGQYQLEFCDGANNILRAQDFRIE
jgi:hypothetical protein